MAPRQKPQDLDAAYELALLHEELGEVCPSPAFPYPKKYVAPTLAVFARPVISEAKSLPAPIPSSGVDDKWATL